jgi:hypothetical protein
MLMQPMWKNEKNFHRTNWLSVGRVWAEITSDCANRSQKNSSPLTTAACASIYFSFSWADPDGWAKQALA